MGMISWYKYKHESSEEILSLVAVKKKKNKANAHTCTHTTSTSCNVLRVWLCLTFFLSCWSLNSSQCGSTTGATAGVLRCTAGLPSADQALHSVSGGFP